jgi:hypothetical protein
MAPLAGLADVERVDVRAGAHQRAVDGVADTLGLKLAQVGLEPDLSRERNGQEPHQQKDRRSAASASVLCCRLPMGFAAAGDQANHAREDSERPK